MNQQTTEMSFQLLIEEDKVQGDFIGYIPAVRLGVQGESLEEFGQTLPASCKWKSSRACSWAKAFD